MFDLFKDIYTYKYFQKNRRCGTCVYYKLGLDTVCKQYSRIPLSVQRGGYCKEYKENRVVK